MGKSADDATGYVHIGNNRLHFHKYGRGDRLLLAFHGYGNNALMFSVFAPYLRDQYTLLSFDLPHHGNSAWTNDMFSRQELTALVKKVTQQYHVNKVALLGYSMGARICLMIIQLMPAMVARAVLMAADGLAFNPWYFFMTGTLPGRVIFKQVLTRPRRYMHIIQWLLSKNLINSKRYSWAMHYLGSESGRSLLLNGWPALKALVPNRPKLRKTIATFQIPVSLYMGIHDNIIAAGPAKKFADGLPTVRLHLLQKGHRVFDRDNAGRIAEDLFH